MPKKLLIINLILLAIAAGSVVFIVRQLMAPMPMPVPRGRAAPAGTTAGQQLDSPRPLAGTYGSVAAKNLFSPTRTEAPVTASASVGSTLPKPNLFGVVLREGAPIAYLEDPATKRVSGYRIGDAVAGGTVQAITADGVSINRPDGKMDVRLRDPGKPRPASQPTAAALPGAQPAINQPLPGVIPPAAATPTPAPALPTPAQPPAVAGQPGVVPQPGQVGPPIIPGRRPLPPNLLRRLPQAPPADAPQQ